VLATIAGTEGARLTHHAGDLTRLILKDTLDYVVSDPGQLYFSDTSRSFVLIRSVHAVLLQC